MAGSGLKIKKVIKLMSSEKKKAIRTVYFDADFVTGGLSFRNEGKVQGSSIFRFV